jgi:hypothetical protein
MRVFIFLFLLIPHISVGQPVSLNSILKVLNACISSQMNRVEKKWSMRTRLHHRKYLKAGTQMIVILLIQKHCVKNIGLEI